jgi:hypothetical protein
LVEESGSVVEHSSVNGLTQSLFTFSDIFEGVQTQHILGRTSYDGLGAHQLIVAQGALPFSNSNLALDKDYVGVFDCVSMAFGDSVVLHGLLDSVPNHGRNVLEVDLFGEHDNDWEHLFVEFCFKP